jgi:hypothetical protein
MTDSTSRITRSCQQEAHGFCVGVCRDNTDCQCPCHGDAADALEDAAPVPDTLARQALAALDALQAVLDRGAAPTVATDPTSPQNGSPCEHGPLLSGEAACPACGQIRGVVYDGASTRCYGCWHCWIPAPTPSVA